MKPFARYIKSSVYDHYLISVGDADEEIVIFYSNQQTEAARITEELNKAFMNALEKSPKGAV